MSTIASPGGTGPATDSIACRSLRYYPGDGTLIKNSTDLLATRDPACFWFRHWTWDGGKWIDRSRVRHPERGGRFHPGAVHEARPLLRVEPPGDPGVLAGGVLEGVIMETCFGWENHVPPLFHYLTLSNTDRADETTIRAESAS
ncbi:MAG: hypothetical protein WC626_09035 [Methanoregula sp.]